MCCPGAQDFEQGSGVSPQDGQEVTFQYTAYNESGNRIDSSYSKGRPASTRLGINGLIPGEDAVACQSLLFAFSRLQSLQMAGVSVQILSLLHPDR